MNFWLVKIFFKSHQHIPWKQFNNLIVFAIVKSNILFFAKRYT